MDFSLTPAGPSLSMFPLPTLSRVLFFWGGGVGGGLKLGSLIGDGAESGGGGDLGTGFDAQRWPGIRQCLLRGMKK